MVRICVSLSVYDRRLKSAMLQRLIEMPSPPTVGLEIGFPGIRDDYWSGEVATVIWDVEAGIYHVELEDWCSQRLSVEEMVKALGPEWKQLGTAA